MAELAAHDAANGEVASDEEYSDESERERDDDEEDDEAVTAQAEDDLPDVSRVRISEPTEQAAKAEAEQESEEERDSGDEDDEEVSGSGSDDEDEDEDQDDESGSGSEFGRTKQRQPRIGRRPVRTGNRDVEAIVSASLSRSKAQQDRRHHGKKPVSANVLGRQKGSKKKQNANAREARTASKQGGGRGGDFF